ncbi:MAG: hypothetical protein H6744_09040 [Deltaproteobacteria bacterium]|nr:hypothetical protein [Deltaproteobacteria bacterium]MCB9786825.1 hypothetical protein [Deltaproteobacteria bacterium]
MLTLYFACLAVGGVLVALSAFAGAADADAGGDLHHDFDAGDADAAGADVDGGFDHELGDAGDHDLGHDAYHPSAADAAHGVKDGAAARKLWLPFSSMRFWTFGSAAFGLTGVLLTALGTVSALVVLLAAAATGTGVGTAVAYAMHHLRRPVNADAVERSDYPGQVGELLLPLRPGATSRIRLRIRHRELVMLARSTEALELPRGARVVVLALDEDGHALVAPEDRLYVPES